ncbi:MAG: PAS domain S-box protein [Bacteroidota bacterium]
MKRFFENLTISTKLRIGFYSILVIFILFGSNQFYELNKLKTLQNEVSSRASDEAKLTEISNVGYKLDVSIASIIIDNASDQSFEEWDTYSNEADSDIAVLQRIVDTDEERALAKKAQTEFNALKNIEQEIVPLIKQLNNKNDTTLTIEKRKNIETNIAELKAQFYDTTNAIYKSVNSVLESISKESADANAYFDKVSKSSIVFMVAFISGAIIISLLIVWLFSSIIVPPIKRMTNILDELSTGKLADSDLDETRKDEIGQMSRATNKLIHGLSSTASFAGEIGNGNLDASFEPLSGQDTLGNALIEMRSSLVKATHEEELRKKEDERRNWSTQGFAKFGEILRQNNDNMEKLSFNIIRNLVEYTGMNQGGLFIFNDNNREHPYLEMTACYAFNRQKFLQKTIEIGEGLVGACYQEGKTIYLTEIPNNYVNITSGLGEANPKCVLIVPLKLNDEIYGIIELASFNNLEQHEIEFVEKVGESIASTISSVKVNIRTAQLLEVSQQQAEEMRAQEEEMRQNMEEMHATQEEMGRKNVEVLGLMNAIDGSMIKSELSNDGIILSVNQKYCDALKYIASEVIGHNVTEYMKSENVPLYHKLIASVISGKTHSGTYMRTDKYGKELWLDTTYSPIYDANGTVVKLMYLAKDVTAAKLAEIEMAQQTEEMKAQEEELRQNMEEMQATQEEMGRKTNEIQGVMHAVSSSLPYIEFDINRKVINCNNEFTKVTGMTKEMVLGAEHKNFLLPEYVNLGKYEELWQKLIKGITHTEVFQHKLPKGDFWSKETLSPIFDVDGNIERVMMFVIDLTEQMILQNSMTQQAEELKAQEEELRQNMEEMQAIQEALEVKSRETNKMLEDQTISNAKLSAAQRTIEDNQKVFKMKEKKLQAEIEAKLEESLIKNAKYQAQQKIFEDKEKQYRIIERRMKAEIAKLKGNG